MSPFQLTGRHIVVIGASSGIGAEAARHCAAAGASLSICARRDAQLGIVIESLTGPGCHQRAALDVADTSAIERCIAQFVAHRGPIDGLVYAAGRSRLQPLATLSPQIFEAMMAVNVTGAIFATKAACRRAAPRGMSVVWVSSMAARRSRSAAMAAYAASKAALEGALTSLALELSRRRIRINAIAPGAVDTDMWRDSLVDSEHASRLFNTAPLGPGTPADIALGCVYLLSDASRWVTGTVLAIDGGMLVA